MCNFRDQDVAMLSLAISYTCECKHYLVLVYFILIFDLSEDLSGRGQLLCDFLQLLCPHFYHFCFCWFYLSHLKFYKIEFCSLAVLSCLQQKSLLHIGRRKCRVYMTASVIKMSKLLFLKLVSYSTTVHPCFIGHLTV